MLIDYISKVNINTPLQEKIDMYQKQVNNFGYLVRIGYVNTLQQKDKVTFVNAYENVVKYRNMFIEAKYKLLNSLSLN